LETASNVRNNEYNGRVDARCVHLLLEAASASSRTTTTATTTTTTTTTTTHPEGDHNDNGSLEITSQDEFDEKARCLL
jgi:hypothetical protein